MYEGTAVSDLIQEKLILQEMGRAGIKTVDQNLHWPLVTKSGTNDSGKKVHYYYNYASKKSSLVYPYKSGTELTALPSGSSLLALPSQASLGDGLLVKAAAASGVVSTAESFEIALLAAGDPSDFFFDVLLLAAAGFFFLGLSAAFLSPSCGVCTDSVNGLLDSG